MGAAAAIPIAATIISTAATVYATQQSANAAEAQADYQAAVGRNNKVLAKRAADDAIARGKIAERNSRQRTQQLIGRQRAALAGSGVVVDQDSALDITSETAGIGELDALTIRSNAEREALGFRAQGENFQAQSNLAAARGDSAVAAANISSLSTLVTGTGRVADKWYAFQREGVI